jgi:hypothetical protein
MERTRPLGTLAGIMITGNRLLETILSIFIDTSILDASHCLKLSLI